MFNDIEIELFRFDAKVDYLPYYKKYKLEYYENELLLDFFSRLYSVEKFNYIAEKEFSVKINNIYFTLDVKVNQVCEILKTNELVIEPISTFRAIKDLMIDKKDFLDSIAFALDYISQEELEIFAKNYILDYYASTTYELHKEYIGDSALLLVDFLIKKMPEKKKLLLSIISDKTNGIFYHTSLEFKIYNYDRKKEELIVNLMQEIPLALKKDFYIEDAPAITDVKQMFTGFNIASFDGLDKNSFHSIIDQTDAKFIALESAKEDLATHAQEVSMDFSLKIAAKILLEAVDKNADFLIVRGKEDLKLFDQLQNKIEKIIGRDIILPIVTRKEFVMIANGNIQLIEKEIKSHKVKVSFID